MEISPALLHPTCSRTVSRPGLNADLNVRVQLLKLLLQLMQTCLDKLLHTRFDTFKFKVLSYISLNYWGGSCPTFYVPDQLVFKNPRVYVP